MQVCPRPALLQSNLDDFDLVVCHVADPEVIIMSGEADLHVLLALGEACRRAHLLLAEISEAYQLMQCTGPQIQSAQ